MNTFLDALGISPGMLWILLTSAFVAVACGLSGAFLVMRRMSLAGDAISHSVLPGIVIGFLFTGALDSPWLLVGAGLAGLAVMLVIDALHRRLGVREDAATGIAFTAFFALGVVLLKLFAGKVDLDPGCVLFGSLETAVHGHQIAIAGMEVPRVVIVTACVVALVVAMILAFGRAWTVTAFDFSLARSLGIPVGKVQVALLALVSLVVVAAFQAVGAILAVALLVIPAATGILLVHRVRGVLIVSVLHALVSAAAGLQLAIFWNCSVAAAIVLVGATLFASAWGWSIMRRKWA